MANRFYVLTNAFRARGRGWQDHIIPAANISLPGVVPDESISGAGF